MENHVHHCTSVLSYKHTHTTPTYNREFTARKDNGTSKVERYRKRCSFTQIDTIKDYFKNTNKRNKKEEKEEATSSLENELTD